MVFGNPVRDRIQLNDDSLWPHDLSWEHPPGRPEDLKRIRKILLKGDATLADSLMVHYFSNKSIIRSHQTLGDCLFFYKVLYCTNPLKSYVLSLPKFNLWL
jgi:alpha-L-fucosidase 2